MTEILSKSPKVVTPQRRRNDNAPVKQPVNNTAFSLSSGYGHAKHEDGEDEL
jgi:hypothetical protein